MGAYLFFAVCVSLWLAFGWAMVRRPLVLDRTWGGVRGLPLLAKPLVWITFLPWLSGLAAWERDWRGAGRRWIAVALVAAVWIAFWASVTFGSGSGTS